MVQKTHAEQLEFAKSELAKINRLRVDLTEINEGLLAKNKDIKYFRKHRTEMKEIIHKLALEIQKLQEKKDAGSDNIKVSDEKIQKRNNDFVALGHRILKLARDIKTDTKKWLKDASVADKKLFAKRQDLSTFEKKVEELEKDTKGLAKIKLETVKANKTLNDTVILIEEMSDKKNLLGKDISKLEEQYEKNLNKKIDIQKLAGDYIQQLLDTIQNTHEYRNHVYFYIRRIVQHYREQGKKAPEVFESFKPHVPIRKDVLLKLKKIERKKT